MNGQLKLIYRYVNWLILVIEEKIRDSNFPPTVIKVFSPRRLLWAGHVNSEIKNDKFKILMEKLCGRWDDNIKINSR